MRAANRRSGRTLFEWSFCTATGTPANLTSGLRVTGPPIAKLDRCDLLLVVAGFNLESHATPALLASLRRLAPNCRAIAGVDGGGWLLARAGLLNGHTATPHWEDLAAFAAEFPDVNAVSDRYVVSGKYMTSGGAAPCIDMMLHLIGARHGTVLAETVANTFIYDPLPSGEQPQYRRAQNVLLRRHPAVAGALRLMETALETPRTIPDIAAALNISPRLLEMRFQTALGQSPHAAYLSLRLSEALRLALDTGHSVHEIALATGFTSQSSFARAFRATHKTSVRALRKTQSPSKG